MFYQGYYLSTTLSLTKYHRQKYVSLIPSLIHCWEGHISFRSQNPLTRYPSLLLVHHEQPDVRKHSLKIHDACIKIERTLPSEQWKLKREKGKSLINSPLLKHKKEYRIKLNYLSVFRQEQSVGKHVGRFLVLSSSGVLTDLKVGNCGLHGTKPSLWTLTELWRVKYLFNHCHTIIAMCTKMRKSAFSDTLNIMRGRARIIKEEEIYIERFY